MKKVMMSLVVLSLAGFLYAGDACCAKKDSAEKTEKKVCAECTKVEGTCDACKAKKAEKTETKTEEKKD